MSELDELYQSVILAHDRSPRNFRELEGEGCRTAEGYNPLCGDRFRVMVRLEGDTVADACFQGQGCAISKASASMMTEMVKGRTVEEAGRLVEAFRMMVREGQGAGGRGEGGGPALPEKLRVFAGVSRYPMRVKCATLAWHALRGAIEGDAGR